MNIGRSGNSPFDEWGHEKTSFCLSIKYARPFPFCAPSSHYHSLSLSGAESHHIVAGFQCLCRLCYGMQQLAAVDVILTISCCFSITYRRTLTS